MNVDDAPFILTAGHVMKAALSRLREPDSHLILGDLELQVQPDAVDLDEARDIATNRLTREQYHQLEAMGVSVVRPAAWPPAVPPRDAAVVAAGYPGTWRLQTGWDELDFRSFSMLAFVHEVRDDHFICHLDPAHTVETRVLVTEELPELDLPGMSGAPAFMVSSDPRQIEVPQLCGVVIEGFRLDGNLFVRFAPLDRISRNGRLLFT